MTRPKFPYTLPHVAVSRVKRKADGILGTVEWYNHRTNGAVVQWDNGERIEHHIDDIEPAPSE